MTCLLKAHRDKKNKDNHDAKEKSSDNQSTSANHDDQTNKIKAIKMNMTVNPLNHIHSKALTGMIEKIIIDKNDSSYS